MNPGIREWQKRQSGRIREREKGRKVGENAPSGGSTALSDNY